MKKLLLIIITLLFMCQYAQAEKRPTGASKICDDIGYLSTSCKNVEVLPFEYKDKEVALEKAKQQITNEGDRTIINISKPETNNKVDSGNDVIIKSWFEEE